MSLLPDQLKTLIAGAIASAQNAGDLPAFEIPPIEVTRPRDPGHGDYTTNVAMQSARLARQAPLKIAEAIASHMPASRFLRESTVAPPGFINFRLDDPWLAQQVELIRTAGMSYGQMDLGKGQSANVEFVSANPTGPLHLGRTWGAVLGDTIANLLHTAGYNVTREYYFNNAGRQMRLLGESVRARYLELLGHPVEFPAEGYHGSYIIEIAQSIVDEHGTAWAEENWEPFKLAAEAWVFENIRTTLARMGIYFDVWFNENSLYESGAVEQTVEALRKRGYAYDADGAIWFRATEFGAEKDRVLIKSSGEPTYRLPDIAYHVNKLERGFDLLVNILGADHLAEYPDVIAGVKALGYDADRIHVVIHQFINLVREGKQVRMSTRRADYITLDDLLDEVTYTSSETTSPSPGKIRCGSCYSLALPTAP